MNSGDLIVGETYRKAGNHGAYQVKELLFKRKDPCVVFEYIGKTGNYVGEVIYTAREIDSSTCNFYAEEVEYEIW